MNILSRFTALTIFATLLLINPAIDARSIDCETQLQYRSSLGCNANSCPSVFAPTVCPVTTGFINCPVDDLPGGVNIFYRRVGTCAPGQPTIFFIHGISSSSDVWACQQQLLCSQYCTVAIDLVGHGQSSKPEFAGAYTLESISNNVICVLDALGITNPIIVGWSLGATIALNLIVNNSADVNVSKLVLVGATSAPLPPAPPAGPNPFGATPAAATVIGNDILGNPNLSNFSTNWNALVVNETCAGITALRDEFEATTEQASLFALQQIFSIPPADLDFTADLPTITVPTLILHGSSDAIFEFPASAGLKAIPDSYLVEFNGKGHAPQATDFWRFNQTLNSFVSGNDLLCALCNIL